MIRIEILLRLLLTGILLFTPIFLLFKNKNGFFKKVFNGLQKSTHDLGKKSIGKIDEKKLEKVKEKAKLLAKGTDNNKDTSKTLPHKDIFDEIDEELLGKKAESKNIEHKADSRPDGENKKNTPIHTKENTSERNHEDQDKKNLDTESTEATTGNDDNNDKSTEYSSPYASTDDDLSPIEKQRIKEKEQQKLKDIRISALTHKERGRVQDYEKKLIEGLALDPDNKEFLEWLSDYYFINGNHIKAMTLLKRLVNQSPEDHKAIRQIGQIYVTQEDFDTARILIEKAISVKGDNPKYHITLVDIHYTQNNHKEAIRAMEKVLKLRPTNINYLLSIATLHEEASEPTKAFGYYSKIIELDPMHEMAKDGLKRLG